MRGGPIPTVLGTTVCAVLAALGAAAFVGALEGRPLELAEAKALALDPELARALRELDGECRATYYVSSRERLPSELRRLEVEVTDVLTELRRASDGRFDFEVLDPAEHPELGPWIAHQGIAPFRMRSVRHDAWTETEIHSTLALHYAGHGRARIEGLRPEHVPSLAKLVLAHLDEMRAPTEPSIVIAGPHTEKLVGLLGRAGRVRRIDFDRDPTALPSDADLFFWIAPESAEREHARALEVFLEDGGSVVLAGSAHRIALERTTSPPRLSLSSAAGPIADVAAELGLQAVPDLLMDPNAAAVQVGDETWPAPWRMRVVAPDQDFRPFGRQPNGTLFLDAPTAWSEDTVRLDELGYDVHVLATGSSRTWAQTIERPVPLDELDPANGRPVGKAALAVLSVPRDPWRGRLVLFGSASPFQDEELAREELAHRELTDVLTDALVSTERRVLRRARPTARTALPVLEPRARILWRIFAIGALPLALLAIAAVRLGRDRARRRVGAFGSLGAGRRVAGTLSALVLATLALGALAPWLDAAGLRLDWTRDSVHELSPATLDLAAGLRAPVVAELCFSSPLPPSLRRGLARLRGRLLDLERAGLELDVVTISVDDLALDERRALEERGVRPLRVARRSEAGASVQTLFAALVLESGGTRTVLEFPNELAFEWLELRLANALWTLERGRAPRVAFAADLPQLTPAEAHVEYRQKGLFAPSGTDVYGLAKELLRLCGFDVVHVNPRTPEPLDPNDRPELLIWMQPRRPIAPMLALVVDHLRAGGHAALLAQHFVMRSRQPQEAGLAVRHWPEPKYTDLESGWLADLGVRLERTVLFDRRAGALTVTSNVERADGSRAQERATSIQPYLIRAVAENWADDPRSARLGDALFASAARLVVDEPALAAAGLTARTLARTSAEAWTYAWSGGDLPPAVLAGPEPGAELPDGVERAPESALWIEVQGSFPTLVPDPFAVPGPPGRLAVVGASSPFENDLLLAPEYDHASLLINLVSDLALGPELGAVAARRTEPRGFSPPDDATRIALRVGVLALGPLAFLTIGALRRGRRRSAPLASARGGAA